MRVYITKTNGLSLENPLQYRQWMIAEIAHGLGCREMGILCYNGSAESDESLKSRIELGSGQGDLSVANREWVSV